MLLLRLNFKCEKADRRLWVGPADMFMKFIKGWHQVDRPTVRAPASDRGEWARKKAARSAHEREKERAQLKGEEKVPAPAQGKEKAASPVQEKEQAAGAAEKEKKE
ncbi:Uncharacterised protein [uncultured archaeon]|nr:Uncharacterised protein [uncultured archaeon]